MTDLQLTGDMFDTPPASRASDPESSKAAEHRITASGVRKKHAEQALDLVRRFPGQSSKELAKKAAHLGLAVADRHEIARRLADLKNKGLARREKPEGGGDCRWWAL